MDIKVAAYTVPTILVTFGVIGLWMNMLYSGRILFSGIVLYLVPIFLKIK